MITTLKLKCHRSMRPIQCTAACSAWKVMREGESGNKMWKKWGEKWKWKVRRWECESGNDLRLICNPGWQPHSHRRAAIFHVLCRIFWRQSITTALGNQPVSLSLPLGSVQSAFLCFGVLIRIKRSETRGCTDYHIKTFPFSFLAFLCVAHNIEAVWMALTLCKRRLGSTLSTIPVHLTVDYSWQQDAQPYYAPPSPPRFAWDIISTAKHCSGNE